MMNGKRAPNWGELAVSPRGSVRTWVLVVLLFVCLNLPFPSFCHVRVWMAECYCHTGKIEHTLLAVLCGSRPSLFPSLCSHRLHSYAAFHVPSYPPLPSSLFTLLTMPRGTKKLIFTHSKGNDWRLGRSNSRAPFLSRSTLQPFPQRSTGTHTHDMLQSIAVAALLLSIVCLENVVQAGPVLEVKVDRAIAFNRQLGDGDELHFGSRAVLLRGEMVQYTTGGSASYHGYTVYVKCSEHLTSSALQQIAAPELSKAAKGLVVELCDKDRANEDMLSFFFSSTATSIPVYFLPHSEASKELSRLLSVAAQRRITERVVLSVGKTLQLSTLVENSTLPSASIESRYVHKPKQTRGKGASAAATPQVLVTAHFDSLGVSPASRTSGGASGAVAAMELWRRLTSTPYSRQESVAPYGVTVLLGSTSRFNYAGTASWISNHTDRELDQFRAVLCLDELLPHRETSKDEPDLYLHVEDALMKRQYGQQVVEQVEAAAKVLGISLKVVSAKTNYQHYDLEFEHEAFASRQMIAMTLSTHRVHHTDQLFRDVRRPPATAADAAVLTKHAGLVEAIVRILADAAPSAEGITMVWPGAASYVQGMLHYASESQRSPVAQNGAGMRQYASTIEHHMRAQATVAQRAALTSASSVATYQQLRTPGITLLGPYEETMQVFLAKSYLFECVVAVAALAALLLFLYVELGLTTAQRLFSD
ncbi:hypothetical protein, conserved [Leishmania tarentolae]|uniref:Uncharacterized protein n=1 Tax=Leishmania tarentolae TaxID=5689 RepID=A0A640KK91_LEITA|nr:hypothetical protein, conserved [Leishmania tarentolae]